MCPASAGHFVDITKNSFLYINAPLFTWIFKFFLYLFGKTYFDFIIIFINYIFFLTTLYFINRLGIFLKNKETGSYAMILFSLVPAVYGMSRQYGHQDYHLIAFITFNIYALLKTNYFENRRWVILYGISAGLGFMIKDSFFIYFFIPFMYMIISTIKQHLKTEQTKNIFLSAAILFLISCPHYCRPEIIKKVFNDPFIETVNVFSFENLRVTTSGMFENFLSPFIFILFFTSFIFFILKYKNIYKNILLLWFLVPWATVTFMPHHKLPEYIAGIIPAQVLIIAISLSLIKKNFIRKFIILLVCLTGILQYISISFNICNLKILYFMPFNRYHYLFYYDKPMAQEIISLAEYLFREYSNKKILVYDIYSFNVSCNLLKTTTYLKDKNIKFDHYYNDTSVIYENDYIMYFCKKGHNTDTMYKNLDNPVIREHFYIYKTYDFKIKDEIYKMIVLANEKLI